MAFHKISLKSRNLDLHKEHLRSILKEHANKSIVLAVCLVALLPSKLLEQCSCLYPILYTINP